MIRRNQTNPGYFRMIARSDIPLKGVGLFVVSLKGRLKKEIIPDITYLKTKEIGVDTFAFKFLPYRTMIKIDDSIYSFTSYESIPKSKWKCVAKCTNQTDCQHLSDVCICTQGECF